MSPQDEKQCSYPQEYGVCEGGQEFEQWLRE